MAIVKLKNMDGSLRYQVKVRDPQGNWYPTPCFTHEDEALKYESDLKLRKRKGAKTISAEAKTVTVREYHDVWSADCRTEVSAGWRMSQVQMFKDYVEPVIGDLTMIEVTTPLVGKVMNRAKEMGRAPQTREHIYTLLRKMFADAVEYYEMLAVNPVKPKFHKPKVPVRERDFLVPAQAWRLLEAVERHYLGPAIWIQMLAGLRVSEVQALRWKHVLFDVGQLLIRGAFNNKIGQLQDYPKQEDWGWAPLAPKLAQYLYALPHKAPDDFVAKGYKGGMLPYETYNRALVRLCGIAGVPVVTTHELRHSCTEIYAQAGCTQEDIRRLLNQKSVATTARYIHRTDDRLKYFASKLGDPFRVIPGTNVPEKVPELEQTHKMPLQNGAVE